MTHHLITLATTLAAFTATTSAQASWTQLAPTTSPSARAGMVGVTDGANVLLFGGKPGPGVEFNDLWTFDGTNWTDITPLTGQLPPARDFYGACFDSGRSRYVLYGGRSSALAADLGDTWEFDGTTWTQMTPAVAPSGRRWMAMAYDAARNESILFGGATGTTYYNDTWSWNGSSWTLKTPATSPSVRGRGALSYDLTRAEMIFYGGRNVGGALSETWQWDGSDWSQLTTVNAPGSVDSLGTVTPGLFAFGMTYDLLRDRHVIFGGTRTGPTQDDTWEFDGTDWTRRAATGPGNRTGDALVFVLGLGKNYLFGGFQGPQWADTWEYQTAPIAAATTFASGCTGSGGTLDLSPDNLPWQGDTATATASNLAAGSLVFAVYGFSNSSWSGGALPSPLNLIHPAAGSGCDLLVSTDAVILLANTGGPLQLATSLPPTPALSGLHLYQQVLEIELAGGLNIASINASNGVDLTIGTR